MNNWKEIRDVFVVILEEKERYEVYFYVSVVFNVIYWIIYEKFYEMVL